MPTRYSNCAVCEKKEHIPRDAYRVCYECGHVWRAEDLVEVFNQEVVAALDGRISRVLQARDIEFCPLCLHDW